MRRRSSRSTVGRRAQELRRRTGDEIRRPRIDAGIRQAALAEAAGIDQGFVSQVERGLREPSLSTLQALASALGADLSVRLFPNTGPAIHDRTQAAISEALLALVGSRWRRFVEVPVHRPARGVIDAVLYDSEEQLFVAAEIESRIDRLEQELRWFALKEESLPSSRVWSYAGGAEPPRTSRLLVVRSTQATRRLAVSNPGILAAAYPADPEAAYAALRDGGSWPGPALLWADVDHGAATIRARPPRGLRPGGARGDRRASRSAGAADGSQP